METLTYLISYSSYHNHPIRYHENLTMAYHNIPVIHHPQWRMNDDLSTLLYPLQWRHTNGNWTPKILCRYVSTKANRRNHLVPEKGPVMGKGLTCHDVIRIGLCVRGIHWWPFTKYQQWKTGYNYTSSFTGMSAQLTHLALDTITRKIETITLRVISSMKIDLIWWCYQWSLFHWFYLWQASLVKIMATSHYQNQWWPSSATYVCSNNERWVDYFNMFDTVAVIVTSTSPSLNFHLSWNPTISIVVKHTVQEIVTELVFGSAKWLKEQCDCIL